jgi:imidazolonepropionase-like amidohydrolase
MGAWSLRFVAKLFFLIVIFPLGGKAGPEPTLILQHVTVIDGMGGAPQRDQTVVISGLRISAVGPASHVKVDKTAKIVDAQGKFLIPGLWDMHVHLAGVIADPAWSKNVLLPLLLANGITGVRDMGGDLDTLLAWKRDVEAGTLFGPHIYAAGPWLSGGGHKSPEQYPVANTDEAQAAVHDLKKRGADFIKIISLPSRDAFFAVADESRKQNISFVGHLPIEVGAAEASNAGMRSIEHFYYSNFAFSLSSKEDELRQHYITALRNGDAAAIAKVSEDAIATYSAEKATSLYRTLKVNNTWVTPTLEGIFVAGHPAPLRFGKGLLAYLPNAVVKDWESIPAETSAAAARTKELAKLSEDDWKLTREMHAAGVSLLAGSDSLDERVIPGISLHLELAQLVKAGFTPMEAIQCATLRAAQFMRQEKEFGTVETGKHADLVLLTRDPSKEIGNTLSIEAVIYRGDYLDRATLDRWLKNAREAAALVK